MAENKKLKSEIVNLELQLSDMKTENLNLKTQNEMTSSQKPYKSAIDEPGNLPKNVTSSKNSTTGSNSPECFEIIDQNSVMVKKRDSIITYLEDNISNNSFNTSEWTNISVNVCDTYDKPSDNIPRENSLKNYTFGFSE